MSRTALIVAGGTGGHIFPGLSVAEQLRKQGWAVHWAGNPAAMEGRLVPQHGVPLHALVFAGFRGKGLLQQMLMPMKLLRAFAASVGILRRVRPDVVLGMGGYVAFPMGMMASLFNVPLVVHEQNSVAGLTNRVLSKLADKNLVAFPQALPGADWVGNPVRASVISQDDPAARYSLRNGPLKLLVLGGSLGAQALNTTVPQALALLQPHDRPQVVKHPGAANHQVSTGHGTGDIVNESHRLGIDLRLRVVGLKLWQVLLAGLVICRAGAMTVAEVAAIGVAALFVPFPHAVDDHQTSNAQFLVAQGAGWLMQQTELNAQALAKRLQSLTRETCAQVAIKAKALAKPEATTHVVNTLERLARS